MGDEDETKNIFLILLKLAVIVGLIVYLPSKVSTSSSAQVINAINSNSDDSTPVATNPQNTNFPITKDKKFIFIILIKEKNMMGIMWC